MGQHSLRDEPVATGTSRVLADPVAPAGLGYPPPSAYVPDPATGYFYPAGLLPRAATTPVSRAPWRRHLPLGIAAAGAAIALVGTGVHLSALTASFTDPGATTASSTTDRTTDQELATGLTGAVTAGVLR